MDNELKLYADIIVPLAKGPFTFSVPEQLRSSISEGYCVKVQFGRQKYYLGVVWKLHSDTPSFRRIKPIEGIVPNSPVISAMQMRFWGWIAEYYMCSLGDVMRAALPAGLKPEGVSSETFTKNIYKPSTAKFIKLHEAARDQQWLDIQCEKLKRSPKQYDLFMNICAELGKTDIATSEVPASMFKDSSPALKALHKKELISIDIKEIDTEFQADTYRQLPVLSEAQRKARIDISEQFGKFNTVLLHGVTSSGKTEIYLHLIEEQLKKGKDVLYLLPEIAITSQMIKRLTSYFEGRVIVYHSKINDRKRTEHYLALNRSGNGKLVLGVRSSLFLPFTNLGLIIIDEEHDASYKQSDPAPRYHARDSAIVLAKLHGAKTLLGSATPSAETFFNASSGKYGHITLRERFGDISMPLIISSDTIKAVSRGERYTHFNKLLADKMSDNLALGKQTILFQNRRGYSPYVECPDCGHIEKCTKCNVTLTYHKKDETLRCHYCGYTVRYSGKCSSCETTGLAAKGFGTEKVEQEIARMLPQARVSRLDRDSVKTAKQYHAIISDIEAGRTDIVIGTQMVTKGFDFENVTLIGVLNADNLLFFPDFRAAERTFQTLIQVAGRAGRKSSGSEVIIQTSQPDNATIRQVLSYDYDSMIRTELQQRKEFYYPPYCRLISITLKARDYELLWSAGNLLAENLRSIFGKRVLGPQPPAIDRIRNEYILSFLLKIEHTKSYSRAKTLLKGAITKFSDDKQYGSVSITINVDPQ